MATMTDTELRVAAPAPQTSGKVDAALVEKAVDALLKWNGAQKQKAQLLEDDQLLYIVVGMNKVPLKGRTNPFSVPLPHPLYQLDGNHEVCLIIGDRPTERHQMGKKSAKEQLEKEGLKIAKVIPLSKLKTDYFSYEAKRKLCGSYDIFLADDRILGKLPKLLGKAFYKKKKHPIPVNLTRGQWKGQITAALHSTFWYLSGGTCSVLKVARVSQPREEIVENVEAVVEGVAQQIPKQWANIRGYFLKTLESTALPLYQALPVMPVKIEVSGLTQQDVGKSLEADKKERFRKEKRARLLRGEKQKVSLKKEGEDEMDVVEKHAVDEKPKKRKRNDVEGKRKVPRKGKVAT